MDLLNPVTSLQQATKTFVPERNRGYVFQSNQCDTTRDLNASVSPLTSI